MVIGTPIISWPVKGRGEKIRAILKSPLYWNYHVRHFGGFNNNATLIGKRVCIVP